MGKLLRASKTILMLLKARSPRNHVSFAAQNDLQRSLGREEALLPRLRKRRQEIDFPAKGPKGIPQEGFA
jgi:hypothetical protein